LADTEFGAVWMLRCGLAVALVLSLVAFGRTPPRGAQWGIATGMLVLAALYVAALAWAGHAAAGVENDGEIQIVADVVHLLAAGAWLGALPGFVFLLRRRTSPRKRFAATRRFSELGAAVRRAAGGERNRERVVPGGRRARARRHALRPSAARKARALRADAGARDGAIAGILAVRLAAGDADARG
jgi:hypothetical protein